MECFKTPWYLFYIFISEREFLAKQSVEGQARLSPLYTKQPFVPKAALLHVAWSSILATTSGANILSLKCFYRDIFSSPWLVVT